MTGSEDLFIRRVYTHKGISVAVDIDLVAKTISLVEKRGNDTFADKKWDFTHRELKYMQGWLNILDAMKHAITEAAKLLKAAEERDQGEFVEFLVNLNKDKLEDL